MNLSNLRESDYEMKQEGDNNGSKSSTLKPNLTTSSWSRLTDPRIVRVSRALGGKDRHSKVCTVRGLRDRRVRLSVPTAIQLYDLQDRLGLNQPSKAVDWLLDAAKNEIDELPPLQIPPGISFGQNLQPMQNPSSQERSIQHDQDGTFVQSCSFFERNPNSSNLPDLLNSTHVVPNTSFLKWDPSNLSLSQFGNDQHDHETVLQYHPPPQTQSYFPSHNHNLGEFDPKQPSFQMVSSSSSGSNFTPPLYTINQGIRPFHLRMDSKFLSSEDDGEHGLNK